jgi:hypothetical protein
MSLSDAARAKSSGRLLSTDARAESSGRLLPTDARAKSSGLLLATDCSLTVDIQARETRDLRAGRVYGSIHVHGLAREPAFRPSSMAAIIVLQ